LAAAREKFYGKKKKLVCKGGDGELWDHSDFYFIWGRGESLTD